MIMRRKSGVGKYIFIGIVIVVICLFLVKTIINSSNKKYTNYVKKYEDAVISYSEKELHESNKTYSFNEMTKILIDNGYLKEFEDTSVLLSGEEINIQISSYGVSVHNYVNETTLENRFEIVFEKDGTKHICTKNECR